MKLPVWLLRTLSTGRSLWRDEVLPLFDLKSDLDETGTLEIIERGVEFKGAGVWTLIFAICIASIGLNVNSTAVIIGAMLISPLMGPIVGTGLALGINDFELLKKGLRNLLVATAVSLVASTLYFLLSPLPEAQSELLARTQPTIYDVLIALFGGATGIVTSTRKERALTALSGVAIATALMPPLCTAGYGLAHGNPRFVLGAIYLFSINSIFICLATFLVVRMLRFRSRAYVDRALERKVQFYMTGFAILVAIPSAYTAYETAQDAFFQSRANRFLSESFRFPQTRILEKRFERKGGRNLIELTLIGKALNEKEKSTLQGQLGAYALPDTVLVFHDTDSGTGDLRDMEARLSQTLRSDIIERLYREQLESLKAKEALIRQQEAQISAYQRSGSVVGELGPELGTLAARVEGVRLAEMPGWARSGKAEPSTVVVVRWRGRPSRAERDSVDKFVRIRLHNDKCTILHEP